MREIKFRGKRIDNGEWVYGDLQCQAHPLTSILTYDQCDGYGALIPVDPVTVGECTGKTAKDGKKVFDGHILHNQRDNSMYEVFWDADNCRFGLRYRFWRIYEGKAWIETNSDISWNRLPYCVVIGNIHDNPELLEVNP